MYLVSYDPSPDVVFELFSVDGADFAFVGNIAGLDGSLGRLCRDNSGQQ